MRKTELLAFLQNQTDFFDPDNLSEVFTASWRTSWYRSFRCCIAFAKRSSVR